MLCETVDLHPITFQWRLIREDCFPSNVFLVLELSDHLYMFKIVDDINLSFSYFSL
jgi:hypothetical protein